MNEMRSKENFPLNEICCTTKGNTYKLELQEDPRRLEKNMGEENGPWKVNEREFFPYLEKKLRERIHVDVKTSTKMSAINAPFLGTNGIAMGHKSLDRLPFERGGPATTRKGPASGMRVIIELGRRGSFVAFLHDTHVARRHGEAVTFRKQK
jgi:hypothetical protein